METLKECNFANAKDLKQQTSLKLSSLDDLKKKIILPMNHKETVEDLIEKCRSLCRKVHCLGKDQYN